MSEQTSPPEEGGIRINKYLALCGYESRRHADRLVEQGLVEINGKRVELVGTRVMPGDYVKVNGKHAVPKEGVTLLLNKPRGYVCSRQRQGKENTVYDLLPAQYRHVNYVGRLDTDSEGLLLLTNKGDMGQRIAHPTNGTEKEYWVTLNQPFDNKVLLQMLCGLRLPDGQQAKAKQVARLSPRRACIVLDQGIKRQIRQMFACLGLRVVKLVRVRIGSLWGGDLLPGRTIELTPEQELLAFTNPRRRRGLLDAAHAFPTDKLTSAARLSKQFDPAETRSAIEEEAHYHFDPADFEGEENETRYSHRASKATKSSVPGKRRGTFRQSDTRNDSPRATGTKTTRSFHRYTDDSPRRGFRRKSTDATGKAPRKFSRRPDSRADRSAHPQSKPFGGRDFRPSGTQRGGTWRGTSSADGQKGRPTKNWRNKAGDMRPRGGFGQTRNPRMGGKPRQGQ